MIFNKSKYLYWGEYYAHLLSTDTLVYIESSDNALLLLIFF